MVRTIERPADARLRTCCQNPRRDFDVEADRRLVEEEQVRVAADRERELHPLLLPARQRAVAAIGDGRQIGRGERRVHRHRRRVVAAEQVHVLAHA